MPRLELYDARKLARPFDVQFDEQHRYWYLWDDRSTQSVDIGAHLEERAVTTAIQELKTLCDR